jgi:hypothetical protein
MFNQMFTLLAAENGSGGVPWWVWVILIIILLVLLWFWFGREEDTEEAPPAQAEVAPVQPDDLKKIEGIGPKVAGLLNQAGITTFQQMVDTGAEKLESILDDAGLQMIDADTWPEQAQLAAAGDWEGLAKLQEELKGGKRTR